MSRGTAGYDPGVDRFDFTFSRVLSWPLALIGVTPWTAHVDVTDEDLSVRFGPWSLSTPRSNVAGASVTGPYLPFKVLGPHVSLADRGVTFGTSWRRGACVRVPGAGRGGAADRPAQAPGRDRDRGRPRGPGRAAGADAGGRPRRG